MSDGAADISQTRPRAHARWIALRAYWWVGVAVVIGWLTWPVASLAPTTGLDPSWQIALHMAASERLTFGRDVLFTYGPYGFLSHPMLVTSATGIASFAFSLVAQFALCAVILRSALRSFPPWAAVLLTYAVAAMLSATGFSYFADFVVLIAFVVAVEILQRPDAHPPLWLVPVGASLAALQLLIKANSGIVCIVIVALAAWQCRPGGWRSEAIGLCSFLPAVVVLWIIAGNSPGSIFRWASEEAHIVRSYTDALAIEASSSGQYLQAGLLLLVATALIAYQVRLLPRNNALALGAAALVFGFVYAKEGFVRDDAVHLVLFFAALCVALLAVSWSREIRNVAAVVVVAALGSVAALVGSSAFAYHVQDHARAAWTEAKIVIRASNRKSALAHARADARARLGLRASLVSELRGHTVDVEPFETSAVWAYGLRWRPQPFLQWYMAYDHALDMFNARRVEKHGAERILFEQHPVPLDDKSAAFMAPETALVLLCRYRELHAAGGWVVLARTKSRCASPRLLKSVKTPSGQEVRVPRPPRNDDVVFARIHAAPTLRARIAALVFKQLHYPQLSVGSSTYRVVADTSKGPLILRAPARARAVLGGRAQFSRMMLKGVASPYRVDFFALELS